METFFNYETMKHTLVLTGYILLLALDCWWISYMVCSLVKWVVKKIKSLITKMRHKKEIEEKHSHE